MEDQNINTKVDPLHHRALSIFVATGKDSKKKVVEGALREVIPQRFFDMAQHALKEEGGEGAENN